MAVISTDDEEVDLTWVRFGSIPLIVTLVLPLILGVFILLKCILNHCCPVKRTTKEEMYGLEGRMTILPNVESSFVVASPPHSQPQQQQSLTSTANKTSPVHNISFQQIKQPTRQHQCVENRHSLSSQPSSLKANHDGLNNGTIPSSPTSTSSTSAAATAQLLVTLPGETQICDSYETVDLSDSLKRSTLHRQNNCRQLPDLPQLPNHQVHNPPRRSSSVLSHDGTSELYATVGEVPQLHSVQPSSASSVNNNDTNPVPPRRTGRQWRRSSHPQAQTNNDNQHFSGDSQDSRGYTSISVREPLSNIIASRSQVANTRNYESHYATVSDDSEEMYAAIEDSDGNYMRIPEDGNRHWLGGPHLASPIPERREANSPLPPPPILSHPIISPTDISPTDASQSTPLNPNPPVYAQVTKKNKKGKAPVTPTMSAPAAVSSSSQANNVGVSMNDMKVTTIKSSSPSPGNSGGQIQSQTSISKGRHPVLETTATAAALLSPIDSTGTEPRRWSKADISYSEFEVVREPMYNSNITRDFGHPPSKADRSSSSSSTPHHLLSTSPPPPPLPQHKPAPSLENKNMLLSGHKKQEDLLDEDNYNVIPEPVLSRHGVDHEPGIKSHLSKAKTNTKNVHKLSNSDNYQEIEDIDFHISNAYQEIERQEPSDYYQEIGAGIAQKNDNDMSANLYQEIDKQKPSPGGSELDEEDPTDQFYESVKPAFIIPKSSHSQASISSLDRKHGYEKLRKKGSSPGIHQQNEMQDSTLDEDEDDDEDDTTMYERVKYPPYKYERLKESRDDLREDLRELGVDDERNDKNLYEDIGYSRVMKLKPKNTKKLIPSSNVPSSSSLESSVLPSPNHDPDRNEMRPKNSSKVQDIEAKAFSSSYSSKSIHNQNTTLDGGATAGEMNLDQLYARVDKTKKKKHNINSNSSAEDRITTTSPTTSSAINFSSSTRIIEIREENPQACIVLRTDREEDNSIEYI